MTLIFTHRFKELLVWQNAKDLSVSIYQLTIDFPKMVQFSIGDQIRRSSLSIPSNIAEGAGRKSNKEFVFFLSVALGSAYELETQLIIAAQLEYLSFESTTQLTSKLHEIQNMLIGLKRSQFNPDYALEIYYEP